MATGNSVLRRQDTTEVRQLVVRCRTLRILIVVCTVLTLLQLFSGWVGNSLSLIGDAAMMGVDVVGYIVALIAEKTKTPRKKKRADRYGAAVSFFLLAAATFFVLFTAMDRLMDDGEEQEEVSGRLMFWFTVLNLAADLVLLRLFQVSTNSSDLDPDCGENLNMSAVLAHLVADLLRAVSVLISGLLIWIWKWDSVATDAWCSFFVSVFIILGTMQIGKRLCWNSKDARNYAAFDDEGEEHELPDITFDAVTVGFGVSSAGESHHVLGSNAVSILSQDGTFSGESDAGRRHEHHGGGKTDPAGSPGGFEGRAGCYLVPEEYSGKIMLGDESCKMVSLGRTQGGSRDCDKKDAGMHLPDLDCGGVGKVMGVDPDTIYPRAYDESVLTTYV